MLRADASGFFARLSTRIAGWTGSHWALFIGATIVGIGLFIFGIDATNIAISVVTLLMLFILQNTQNRDSAALHLKLDDLITRLEGPRDELAGVESKPTKEIKELASEDQGAVPIKQRHPSAASRRLSSDE
jgi:low affinity Fe/Cu permease